MRWTLNEIINGLLLLFQQMYYGRIREVTSFYFDNFRW